MIIPPRAIGIKSVIVIRREETHFCLYAKGIHKGSVTSSVAIASNGIVLVTTTIR